MRIALFSEVFLPKVDGIVNTLCHVLDHLHRRGHESILFCPNRGPGHYKSTQVTSLRAFDFPLYKEVRVVYPQRQAVIKKILTDFQPDLIHVFNPLWLGYFGMRWGKRNAIPTIASYHTDIAGFAKGYGCGWMGKPIWAALRWIHSHAGLNLGPSQATVDDMRVNGIRDAEVWSRGVNADLFTPAQYSIEMRNRLSNNNPDAPLLLYVGRVAAEKRIHWLRPILDKLPQARLAIVGDGPARADLERLFAGTNTVFTGYLRGEALASAYASADIFTFPSMHETFGNVLLEAMASGLPVVAAEAGGPLDFVEHNVNGLFFNPHQQNDLVAATSYLVQDETYRKQMGANARKSAESRSWDAVLDKLFRQYANMADVNNRLQTHNKVLIPSE